MKNVLRNGGEKNTRPDFIEKQLRVWQFCGKPLESELAFFSWPGWGKQNRLISGV